jgi:hypothetical protein
MAALVVVVVDRRHLLLAALAQTLARRKTATKEISDQRQPIQNNPCWLYIEVSNDLACGIFFGYRNIAVEHLNINVQPTRGLGYVTTVPTIRMPRRLVLTANGYHLNRGHFAFIVDVLLVPLIFDVRTCFDLYLEPFGPGSPSWFMGSRRLRDNVLLLRRLAVQGTFLICAVEQCDIPEEIRNRADYRLVLTIPVCHLAAGSGAQGTSAQEERGLFLQLEMEF